MEIKNELQENLNFSPLRGDIVWVNIPYDTSKQSSLQQGLRPYLIISNNLNNFNSTVLTAIPTTTKHKRFMPTHLSILINEHPCILLAEQITSINKFDILGHITTLDNEDMNKIEEKIKIQLGLKGEEYAFR